MKTIFECAKCGAQTPKWTGRCLECGAWGTLQENANRQPADKKTTTETTPGKIIKFNEITKQKIQRIQTQISEFDRVMGGGIVPGSLTLLGGEPGIGKSTLILQIAEKISLTPHPTEMSPLPRRGLGGGSSVPPPAEGVRGRVQQSPLPQSKIDEVSSESPLPRRGLGGGSRPAADSPPHVSAPPQSVRQPTDNCDTSPQTCLYASGEESAQQIKLRIERLNLNPQNIQFLGDTSAETIIATIKQAQHHSVHGQAKPNFVIIDSIQTITSNELPSEAGAVNQIRACTVKLLELTKQTQIPIFIIGHITKDGIVAGPKTLEHLVDTVLYLEGDRYHNFRILRTIKNRFGATNEVGIFDMQTNGLVEIKNPSAVFLENREQNIAGSIVTVLMEGTRPFLVEVQALVNSTAFGLPQRRASGFDPNRLQLLIAVLTKRCALKLHNQDITINIAGGFKIQEPAVDLAVCLAIASAFKNKPIDIKTAAFGEIGLSGEVRTVNQTASRIKEAEKLGFENIITYTKNQPQTQIKIIKIKNLTEALDLLQ